MARELSGVRIRDFLLTNVALVAKTGQRIYFSRELPSEYHPDPTEPDPEKIERGPGILLWVRGGTVDYTGFVTGCDVIFECYATDELTAQELAEVQLFEALHDKRGKYILYATQTIAPILLTAPNTDWPMSTVPYMVHVRHLP